MNLSSPIADVIPGSKGAILRILAATAAPLTGSKIAELSDGAVSQSGVSLAIEQLVGSGLVTCQEAGASKLYALNREHVGAVGVIAAAGMRDLLLARIEEQISAWPVAASAAWLFGSFVRGDGGTESDIDLILIRPVGIDAADERWDSQTVELMQAVERWSGNRCEIVELDEDELAALVDAGDPLVGSLRREAVGIAGQRPRDLVGA